MPHAPQQRFKVYHGPNLFAAFPAVVADFSIPFGSPISAAKIVDHLAGTLSGASPEFVELPQGYMSFAEAVVFVTRFMQDVSGVGELPVEMLQAESGSARIAIGFRNQRVATEAFGSALQIASMVFAIDQRRTDPGLASAIEKAVQTMRSLRPDFPTRSLLRAARDRHIPVYHVASSGGWHFGQGSAGLVYTSACTTRNSFFGTSVANSKYLSNQLVMELGLPGVEHGPANTFESALQVAQQLSFPVVVKPINLRRGQGVTANILDAGELRAAFTKAKSVTQGPVLVERHVPGDDHRLAVFGGKLKWVSRRSPARIVGNGHNTVAELIELENGNRSEADIAAGLIKRLVVDADMQTVLAKQGLTLADRPTANRTIALRSVANVAYGGTITDCTASIHPDNREMAEAIARGFRLEATGIDFITTDISRSWCELPCAVIEVNAVPGFSGQARAEKILAESIPLGSNGTLPSIVLIGADQLMIERVTATLQPFVQRVGQTDGSVTLLAGQARCRAGTPLPARVQALVLDPLCDALVIGASVADIDRYGLPIDHFDLGLIVESTSIRSAHSHLIKACAKHVIDGVTMNNFDTVARAIAAKFGNKGAQVPNEMLQ